MNTGIGYAPYEVPGDANQLARKNHLPGGLALFPVICFLFQVNILTEKYRILFLLNLYFVIL